MSTLNVLTRRTSIRRKKPVKFTHAFTVKRPRSRESSQRHLELSLMRTARINSNLCIGGSQFSFHQGTEPIKMPFSAPSGFLRSDFFITLTCRVRRTGGKKRPGSAKWQFLSFTTRGELQVAVGGDTFATKFAVLL
eukprot:6182668-Pleurochrysis_carterae.AAC.3